MSKDINIKQYTQTYRELYTQLVKMFEALEKRREAFPQKYSEDASFEDFTLEASNLKHEAIKLNRSVLALHSNAKIDLKYLTSHVLIKKADDILKDAGFDKLTDSLRSAAVASNTDLNDFAKVAGQIEALFESVRTLPKAFETDETNQRVFSGYSKKLSGF